MKKETEIHLARLNQKGKNLGLSYAQTLSLLIFEKILCEVNKLDIRDRLWLKDEEFQIQGWKKKHVPNEIVYYMQDISYQLVLETIQKVLERKNDTSVAWRLDFYDRELVVDMEVALKQAPVSFKIKIRPVYQKEQYLEEGSYHTVLLPEQDILYQKYPIVPDIVENFFCILDRLELIGDMGVYGSVYRILRKTPLTGRHIYLNLKEQMEESTLSDLPKRMKTVLSYRSYGYMKKCWNRYIKGCDDMNREEDSWEQVMDLIRECILPVWEAVEKDEIFIGDWMPQLGRYL